MSKLIRVAAIQMCSGVRPEANLQAIGQYVAEAAEGGARYVLTPEVSVAFVRDAKDWAGVAEPFEDNSALAVLRGFAETHRIYLHIGSLAIMAEDGKFLNRSVLIGPNGDIIVHYDKVHLFDADPPGDRPYRESATFLGGDKAVLTEAAGMQLGLAICYDLRFPKLFNALAGAGAEVLTLPAAFTVPTGQAHWEVLLRARAIETGSFVIAAAQGGNHENGRATFGHSMIIDPWGEVIAELPGDAPGVLMAELDLNKVSEARARVPALANQRSFSLSVNSDLV